MGCAPSQRGEMCWVSPIQEGEMCGDESPRARKRINFGYSSSSPFEEGIKFTLEAKFNKEGLIFYNRYISKIRSVGELKER